MDEAEGWRKLLMPIHIAVTSFIQKRRDAKNSPCPIVLSRYSLFFCIIGIHFSTCHANCVEDNDEAFVFTAVFFLRLNLK